MLGSSRRTTGRRRARRRLAPPLVVNDLVKSHDVGLPPAVAGISFQVDHGSVLGLLGPNGAGKSTTVGCIAGLLRPDSGSALVKGYDPATSPREVSRRLGVARQDVAVYPDMAVIDNLRFFGALTGMSSGEITAEIEELATTLGLERRLSRRVRDLSGGQQRLVHVACSALHRPALLVLDEPTAGLDVHARERVLDLVDRRRRDGSAILYSSHYLQEVEEVCDSVVIIDAGRVVAEGSVKDVVQEHGSARVEIDVAGVTYRHEGEDVASAVTTVAGLGAIDDVRIQRASLESVFIDLTSADGDHARSVVHVT